MAIISTNLTKIGQNVEDIQTKIGDTNSDIIPEGITMAEIINHISSLNYSLHKVTPIDDGYGDLNDYLDIGIYVLGKNKYIENTLNCPAMLAGTLFVTDTTGSNKSFEYTYAYRVQTYITHKGDVWIRYIMQDSVVGEITFSTWETDVRTSTITSATDLDSIMKSGMYNIMVSGCLNSPISSWGTLIVHFESTGTPYQIYISDGHRSSIYKRGYNRTTKLWETSWRLIGDDLSTYLKNKFTLVRNTNLDTMTIPGTYQVINDDSSIDLNFPSGINGLLIIMQVSDTYIRQFYFRYGTVNKTDMYWYTRQINVKEGDAGTWKRILSEDDITPSAVTNASLSRDAGYIQDNMTIQYVKCGHIVTVTVAGSMSSTATATYNGLILGYNLPIPVMRTCGVVRVDGDSDSCLVVNSSGCIFIEVRNKSVAGKSITGSVTYICK